MLHFEIFVDDMPRDKLTAHSIFGARVKDGVFLSHRCLCHDYPSVEIRDIYPSLVKFRKIWPEQ